MFDLVKSSKPKAHFPTISNEMLDRLAKEVDLRHTDEKKEPLS